MLVSIPRAFVSTKRQMGLKDISPLIHACFPFFTHCTRANVSDDQGLIEMLRLNVNYFKSKPVNIPKITILLDHGYHPEHLAEELEKIYPQIMTKIKLELSTKPSKQEKAAQGKSGLIPAIARWVIERSNAWMERCKILTKNFEREIRGGFLRLYNRAVERTLSNATSKINLCFIRLMIKRLQASS
jgi:hypothetical protein